MLAFGKTEWMLAEGDLKHATKARGRQPIFVSIVLFGLGPQKVHFHK